uniref:Uncharacterized protein n=1 Tax=Ciona intestinalis TaxID=7719 RepID=H2XQ84_CIOIN
MSVSSEVVVVTDSSEFTLDSVFIWGFFFRKGKLKNLFQRENLLLVGGALTVSGALTVVAVDRLVSDDIT